MQLIMYFGPLEFLQSRLYTFIIWAVLKRKGVAVESRKMGQLTCVCPGMPLQFITACEPLPAEHPVADERALSCVQAHVGPQQ